LISKRGPTISPGKWSRLEGNAALLWATDRQAAATTKGGRSALFSIVWEALLYRVFPTRLAGAKLNPTRSPRAAQKMWPVFVNINEPVRRRRRQTIGKIRGQNGAANSVANTARATTIQVLASSHWTEGQI